MTDHKKHYCPCRDAHPGCSPRGGITRLGCTILGRPCLADFAAVGVAVLAALRENA